MIYVSLEHFPIVGALNMARNHEKNYGQLNRWWLHHVYKDVKKEQRPRLEHLKTAAEIKKWLPLIKEEMEFCLTQSQVPCYTDGKVDEYRRRIVNLEKEYKNFIRKLRRLDSTIALSTSTVQPYQRKRLCEESLSLHPATGIGSGPTKYEQIRLPVLDQEGNQPLPELSADAGGDVSGGESVNQDLMDQPLTFNCSTINDASTEAFNGKKLMNPLGINYSSSGEED